VPAGTLAELSDRIANAENLDRDKLGNALSWAAKTDSLIWKQKGDKAGWKWRNYL
jgi:hypothetical protein